MNGSSISRWKLPSQLACHALLGLLLLHPAHAATNIYTSSISGKWETPANWSLGAPGSNDFILLTNAATKTVTIDATTLGSFPGTMTVSNLTLSTPVGATNTLLLDHSGFVTPLRVLNAAHVGLNSRVLIDGSALAINGPDNGLIVGSSDPGPLITNALMIVTNGGKLATTEAKVGGEYGSGKVVVTGPNSLWTNSARIFVTLRYSDVGVTVSNGARLFAGSHVYVGSGSGSDGSEALVSGEGSSWTNLGILFVGNSSHSCRFTVSNGATALSSNAMIGVSGTTNNTVLVTGSNSLWAVRGAVTVGPGALSDQLVIVDGGAVIVTNAARTASLTVNGGTINLGNGTLKFDKLILTNGARLNHLTDLVIAPDSGDNSTVNIADTTFQAAAKLILAPAPNALAQLTISDGSTLIVTNGPLGLGNDGTLTGGSGTGRMLLSNATVMAASALFGSSTGGSGHANVASGGHLVTKGLARNQLVVSGGKVDVVSGPLESFEDPFVHNRIVGGYLHDSEMDILDGTVTTPELIMGVTSGKTDVLKMSGGMLIVQSNLVLGDCTSGANGVIDLQGGSIYVTNATQDAALVLRQGTLTVSNGTIYANRIIATNGCRATITNMNGGITYGHIMVDPGGDIDNDGLPNAWEQAHGLDILSSAGDNGAAGDPDGDGQSNLNEYLAGTDPRDARSAFRALGVRLLNQDVRVDWAAGVGRHDYKVQLATNFDGGPPANFFDLSPVITVDVTNEVTTNYLHINAVTNRGGAYRVRLLPRVFRFEFMSLREGPNSGQDESGGARKAAAGFVPEGDRRALAAVHCG